MEGSNVVDLEPISITKERKRRRSWTTSMIRYMHDYDLERTSLDMAAVGSRKEMAFPRRETS